MALTDLAELQRWIVDRKVSRLDDLSSEEARWENAGERSDLIPFFNLIERVDALEARLGKSEPSTQGTLISASCDTLPTTIVPESKPARDLTPVPVEDRGATHEGPPLRDVFLPWGETAAESLDETDKTAEISRWRWLSAALLGFLGVTGAAAVGYGLLAWATDTGVPEDMPSVAAKPETLEPPLAEESTTPAALPPAPVTKPATPSLTAATATPAALPPAPVTKPATPMGTPPIATVPPPAEAKAVTAPSPKPRSVALPPAANEVATPPPKTSARAALDSAWSAIDRADYAAALSGFRSIVESNPDNADAQYGYGYALLKTQNIPNAQQHLCRAKKESGPESTIGREIDGVLSGHALTCP